MTPKPAFRFAFPAAAVLATLTALVPVPAAAAEMVCRANYDFSVEVNGAYPPDARFFVADARGKFLVDIPSQSKSVLIDMPTKKAVAVPRTSITPTAPTASSGWPIRAPPGRPTPWRSRDRSCASRPTPRRCAS